MSKKETYKQKAERLEHALVRIHSAYFKLAEDDFSPQLYRYLDEAIQKSMSEKLKHFLRLAVERKAKRQQGYSSQIFDDELREASLEYKTDKRK